MLRWCLRLGPCGVKLNWAYEHYEHLVSQFHMGRAQTSDIIRIRMEAPKLPHHLKRLRKNLESKMLCDVDIKSLLYNYCTPEIS